MYAQSSFCTLLLNISQLVSEYVEVLKVARHNYGTGQKGIKQFIILRVKFNKPIDNLDRQAFHVFAL